MAGPKIDFHIHTKYLGCGNATMEVAAIVRECERLGVTALGFTDHLNSLDQLEQHRPILEEIKRLETPVEIYFGVELNYTGCDQSFVYSREIQEEYGFQFALGGIHATYLETYELKKLVEIQHRHHLKTCADPLVNVLVHPYWFAKAPFDRNGWPWFDSMKAVPAAYARELAQAAKETDTAIEINAMACLCSKNNRREFAAEYYDYLAVMVAEGPRFSLGSDAHDLNSLAAVRDAWSVADRLGLPPERIWLPDREPITGGHQTTARVRERPCVSSPETPTPN